MLPEQAGPTLDRALDLIKYVTNEMEQRGMRVRCHYRPTMTGCVIAFSDADPPPGSKAPNYDDTED